VALGARGENIDLRRAGDIEDNAGVRHALVWKPPPGFFANYPRLALVINLGAGSTRCSAETTSRIYRSPGCPIRKCHA